MKQIFTFFILLLVVTVNAQINPVLINQNLANYEIFPQSIAYYNGEIIIPDLDNDRIIKTSATITDAPIITLVSNVKFPTDLKVIGNELFFLQAITTTNPTNNSGKLSKINLNVANPPIVDVLIGLNIPIVLEGNANSLYITELIGTFTSNDFDDFNFQSTSISKINLTGTPSKTILFQNREYIEDIKLNNTDLYWSESFENSDNGKIYKYDTTLSTPSFTEYHTLINDLAIRMTIHNNTLYFATDTGTDIIKGINLLNSPVVIQTISNPFYYNSINTNPNAMVVNGNNLFVSSSYFDGNNNEKELLYKLDLSTLSTSEFSNDKALISFFPNPTIDIVNFNKELLGIQVYDISGRLVLENKKSSNIYDISNLKSGNYIINGVTTDNKNFSLKLIKK